MPELQHAVDDVAAPELAADSVDMLDGAVDGQADFALETDLQVQDAVAALQQVDGIAPERWQSLDSGGRLEVLQNVEEQMAAIQGRPSVEVTPSELGAGTYGAFDGQRIMVNAADLNGDQPVGEFVDTIVHEGRHAYQNYAVDHPGFVTDAAVVGAWADNMAPGNYLSAEQYGQELYASQPVEADAWNYASRVIDGLGLPR